MSVFFAGAPGLYRGESHARSVSRLSFSIVRHDDDTQVVVLQLRGCKRWKVYGAPPVALPYAHEQVGKTGAVPEATLAADNVVVSIESAAPRHRARCGAGSPWGSRDSKERERRHGSSVSRERREERAAPFCKKSQIEARLCPGDALYMPRGSASNDRIDFGIGRRRMRTVC